VEKDHPGIHCVKEHVFIFGDLAVIERNIPYVIRTNKMHTFYINDLIQLYRLRQFSNNQVFILRKTCTGSLMTFFHASVQAAWSMSTSTRLRVQVFLRMNTWLFEICRRRYNWIKSLMKKKVCTLLVLICISQCMVL